MNSIEHYLNIPLEVQPRIVRNALSSGHGYNWIQLSSRTKDVYYGETTYPNMPMLRMIGRQIVIEGHDSQYVEPIERILSALKSVQGGRYLD